MSSADISSELESFRERWRAEVRAKQPGSRSEPQASQPPAVSSASSSRPARPSKPPPKPSKGKNPAPHDNGDNDDDDDGDYVQPRPFDELSADGSSDSRTLGEASEAREEKAPVSALDHYEKAVERETVGKLGDSLQLYRKAFRMDHRVDQKYKNKHFPATSASKPPQSNTSTTLSAGSNAAHGAPSSEPQLQPIKELIASFSGLAIEGRGPEIEGTPRPPCPIANLPAEILVHIMRDVAVLDVGDFVRLARVCKRLAYLVATESQIWRRVCLGSEFGFGGMHYHWQRTVLGAKLDPEPIPTAEEDDEESLPPPPPPTAAEAAERRRAENAANTYAYLGELYASSWQRMFRRRPRVRFNGCYISTVNYIRAGQASVQQVTWGSPVHIVTYYRYLRLFRDGTALALTTTSEPAEVVHHLTREAVAMHAGGAMAHLPSAVVRSVLRGRWRLSRAEDNPDVLPSEAEGDLFVETEGVGKYIYRMDLSLRSAGKGTRNNKLAWRGFYSYDPLTDDWAEFGLRNDKPFFFSRVKSYGVGE